MGSNFSLLVDKIYGMDLAERETQLLRQSRDPCAISWAAAQTENIQLPRKLTSPSRKRKKSPCASEVEWVPDKPTIDNWYEYPPGFWTAGPWNQPPHTKKIYVIRRRFLAVILYDFAVSHSLGGTITSTVCRCAAQCLFAIRCRDSESLQAATEFVQKEARNGRLYNKLTKSHGNGVLLVIPQSLDSIITSSGGKSWGKAKSRATELQLSESATNLNVHKLAHMIRRCTLEQIIQQLTTVEYHSDQGHESRSQIDAVQVSHSASTQHTANTSHFSRRVKQSTEHNVISPLEKQTRRSPITQNSALPPNQGPRSFSVDRASRDYTYDKEEQTISISGTVTTSPDHTNKDEAHQSLSMVASNDPAIHQDRLPIYSLTISGKSIASNMSLTLDNPAKTFASDFPCQTTVANPSCETSSWSNPWDDPLKWPNSWDDPFDWCNPWDEPLNWSDSWDNLFDQCNPWDEPLNWTGDMNQPLKAANPYNGFNCFSNPNATGPPEISRDRDLAAGSWNMNINENNGMSETGTINGHPSTHTYVSSHGQFSAHNPYQI